MPCVCNEVKFMIDLLADKVLKKFTSVKCEQLNFFHIYI